MSRLVAAALLVGLLLSAPWASAQDLHHNIVGLWLPVDRVLAAPVALLRFDEVGRAFQLEASLRASAYVIEGDSLRTTGGDYALLHPTGVLFFRLRGDSLWVGEDRLAEVRIGPRLGDARDSLTGRWGYERHGNRFERAFTMDGRIVLSIVHEGSHAWRGDTLALSMAGRSRTTIAAIRDGLLVLTDIDGDGGEARFRRIADMPDDIRAELAFEPSPMACRALHRESGRLVEGRIFKFEGKEDELWGDFHHATREVHLLNSLIGRGRIAALAIGHLAAHALGFGPTPETEWVAEKVVRACLR